MKFSRKSSRLLFAGVALSAMTLAGSAAYAYNGDPDYLTYDGGADLLPFAGPGDLQTSGPSLGVGFEGITQYDAAAFQRNFIPPDTMGAVGTTQFMETSNGAYAVYSKTGALLSKVSDVAFWAAAGMTGANGDSRVLFDSRSGKWIVESFAASISTIQIAISNTSDATGGWKSTSFVGVPGGIADYPTLAIDDKAVYIGTNDFNGAGTAFLGTTLNVINRDALFGASGPDASGVKQFFTSVADIIGGTDRGFAIQGVNQLGNGDSGKIIAVGANNFGFVTYDVNNPGSASATQSAPILLSPGDAYDVNGPARQPNTTGTGSPRVIDTLDDRISSAVYELGGKIYALHTITPTGTDHTEVQWQVIDAATSTILATGVIGGNGDGFDYYQGSIAVNASGQVVIGYNRSGSVAGTGEVRIFANTYNSVAGGGLTQTGSFLLKVSETDSYHNGSTDGLPAAGRQRWGDYSQVTVDPTNQQSFWVIGEFADEFNDAAHGHPGGTGGSRWGTWISDITLGAVPEPATWGLMILGFGLVGATARRRRALAA